MERSLVLRIDVDEPEGSELKLSALDEAVRLLLERFIVTDTNGKNVIVNPRIHTSEVIF